MNVKTDSGDFVKKILTDKRVLLTPGWGFGKTGKEKSHSWSYNGTSRFDTLEEQKEYCKKKIMRDEYHYWTIFNYEEGKLVELPEKAAGLVNLSDLRMGPDGWLSLIHI